MFRRSFSCSFITFLNFFDKSTLNDKPKVFACHGTFDPSGELSSNPSLFPLFSFFYAFFELIDSCDLRDSSLD